MPRVAGSCCPFPSRRSSDARFQVTFQPLRIAGAFVIDAERVEDERGYFARTWCSREFSEKGCPPTLAQISLSVNRRAGTLRGMHMQAAPHEESKLVRCARGSIYDVVLDLRRESETFRQWQAVEVTAGNGCMVYVREGAPTAFRRWSMIAKSSTTSRSSTIRRARGDSDGMTPRSASTGPCRLQSCRSRTAATRTSFDEAGADHGRRRLYRPGMRAAARHRRG